MSAEDVYLVDPSTYANYVKISDGIRSYRWRILDLLVATGQTDLVETIIIPGSSVSQKLKRVFVIFNNAKIVKLINFQVFMLLINNDS